MVTKSSREMQKDREKIRPPFGGLKFCQGTHYLPLTLNASVIAPFAFSIISDKGILFSFMVITPSFSVK